MDRGTYDGQRRSRRPSCRAARYVRWLAPGGAGVSSSSAVPQPADIQHGRQRDEGKRRPAHLLQPSDQLQDGAVEDQPSAMPLPAHSTAPEKFRSVKLAARRPGAPAGSGQQQEWNGRHRKPHPLEEQGQEDGECAMVLDGGDDLVHGCSLTAVRCGMACILGTAAFRKNRLDSHATLRCQQQFSGRLALQSPCNDPAAPPPGCLPAPH